MILEKFVINNNSLEELEAKIAQFNIFEAVGMIWQEIKHSNFISFLLNPTEKHQLGDLFLKKVLVKTLIDAENTPADAVEVAIMNLRDAEVRREWKNIDLLIHSPSNRFVCTIENKVNASESNDQLEKYKNVVETAFPNCTRIFIFLTKEGSCASQPEWLTLSYSTVADIIETICNERRSTIGDEVYIVMQHYVDLVRRHIMSESDIAELCRKIYKQHRQAIDLIYEHRPDLQSDIQGFLEQIIEKSAQETKFEKDDCTKKLIRFAPKEWDDLTFQKTCERWTRSKRILQFEFINDPQSLRLSLIIGPGEDKGVRQDIYNKLQELKLPGFRKNSNMQANWPRVWEEPILQTSDYEDDDLEKLQDKIEAFWKKCISDDIKKIREAIFNSFDKN
jgi:hypothetical protein